MKGIEIRDFCGDYALDIPMGDRSVHTIYFNSRRNAEMVKRIMEIDDSVPNAATVCDMVEVVRCKDCVCFKQTVSALFPHATAFICDFPYGLQKNVSENDFCCHGERKEQT